MYGKKVWHSTCASWLIPVHSLSGSLRSQIQRWTLFYQTDISQSKIRSDVLISAVFEMLLRCAPSARQAHQRGTQKLFIQVGTKLHGQIRVDRRKAGGKESLYIERLQGVSWTSGILPGHIAPPKPKAEMWESLEHPFYAGHGLFLVPAGKDDVSDMR